MQSYYIYMDQGIAANLRDANLCSGQFGSCAPIVMYNANDHDCALYHLAGCNSLDKLKMKDLHLLASCVGPTIAYVLTGAADTYSNTGPFSGHVGPVTAFFRSRRIPVTYDFNGRSDFSSVFVSLVAGKLDISPSMPADRIELKTKSVIKELPDIVGFVGEDRDEKLKKWR